MQIRLYCYVFNKIHFHGGEVQLLAIEIISETMEYDLEEMIQKSKWARCISHVLRLVFGQKVR